jgi:hypothetical protein
VLPQRGSHEPENKILLAAAAVPVLIIAAAVFPRVIGVLLIAAVITGAYWLPAIVASRRGVANRGSVVAVNCFLGWTAVGWVVALAMAMRDVP